MAAFLDDNKLNISYVLLTQLHGDHTGVVSNIAAYKPEPASMVYKSTPDPGQLPIEDGQTFQVEGATVSAFFTPVHATEKTTPSTLETPTTTLVVEIALSRFWEFMSVVPSAVIGHSLGEYAVLVAAAGSHVMLSVRAGIDTINSAMSGDSSAQFELSCVNGPKDNVVSGERADMDRVKSRLESISLKCMVLDIPYAFHAAQLDFTSVLQAAREMGIVD
ncbi:Non-reducing polyketide synthase nscA [Colletotrichum sidae]|uniref:Non-reducing polyketide synthase nscA n=1 Tax=Colletotrichum sidae TaxID=1347389 RepID=A0A4R8TCS5_9PEZI|nr:Non-reducing polyketide synthase nscA [Colletotrichum sidae]